jgi:hypothetical protein
MIKAGAKLTLSHFYGSYQGNELMEKCTLKNVNNGLNTELTLT